MKSSIPQADQQLVSDLQQVLEKVRSVRKDLYHHRAGCACDETQLCAHHAAVDNHLDRAATSLALAINQSESE